MHNLSTISIVIALMACSAPESKVTRLTPDVTVAPGEVLFGDVVPSFSVDQTVQIVNAGRTTLEISDIALSDGSTGFSFEIPPQFDEEGVEIEELELERSESLPVSIYFAPEDFSAYEATLVISSNDEDTPTLEVPISGTGVVGPLPDIAVSPGAIDFGLVTTDETSTEYVLVSNAGDGPLEIYDTYQSGSGSFAVVTDPAGQSIAPGSEATVLVTYTPTGGQTGHTGTLTFTSNDPDEPEVSIDLTGGDGGPDTDYPLAVISADDEVNPPELVPLDGSGSTDPADTADEYDMSYAWSIVDQPLHSYATLSDPSSVNPFLDIDVAGEYTVQLIVTDYLGVTSAPTQHTVRARPVEDLYIALTWDKANSD
ncbi:MAG: choice-of-anchor D domain-containing protein, partial [Myxococcota bacterium]